MNDFAPDTAPVYRRPAQPVGPSWLSQFSATLCAVLVGGLILGVAARAYIHWSVKDAAEQMKAKMEGKVK